MFLLKGTKIIKYKFKKATMVIEENGDCFIVYETEDGIKRTLVLSRIKKVFVFDSSTFNLLEFVENFPGTIYLYDVNKIEFNPYSKAAIFTLL